MKKCIDNRTTYMKCNKNEYCCGCEACESVCPTDAIKMIKDSEGFNYPSVNEDKCINCGRCRNVCPIDNVNLNTPIKSYVAVNNDVKVLDESTSGGVFRALATTVLNQGGMICGAIIENNVVYHVLSDDIETVRKMSGSKYVQSDIRDVYNEIKQVIKTRKVLFTGTPCQCAALKKMFKQSENIITMDFVCHGVPSPDVFEDYIQYLEKKHKEPIQYLRFRHKSKTSCGLFDVYRTKSGKEINKPFYDSYYLSAFQMALYTRLACNKCKYANLNRCSDVTVCDYWGVEKYHSNYDPIKGVSAIIVNTNVGEQLLDSSKNLLSIEETDIECVVRENNNLKFSTPKNINRDKYYERRLYEDFETLAKEYMIFPGKYKYKIKAIIPYKVKKLLKRLRKLPVYFK